MPKGEKEAAKTHCPYGHPYDAQNTLVVSVRGGRGFGRQCRQCIRNREIERQEARKTQRRAGGKVIVLNANKTHCSRGHEYNEANTRIASTGSRVCVTCELKTRFDEWPEKMMWQSAKSRAKKKGVPFTITPEDIVVPPCCPVLGVVLERKATKGPGPHSPSLDRIEAAKGYVPGNIVVISLRANRIKNDATLEELERVTAWLRTTMKGRG